MPAEIDRTAVLEAVASVVDPCSIATGRPVSLIEMGLLTEVTIQAPDVTVTLALTSPVCLQAINIVAAVEDALSAVPGVERARCKIDAAAEWDPEMIDPIARAQLRALRPRGSAVGGSRRADGAPVAVAS
jgi:metal-sulfur cluster biosynthetic enzyme